MKIEINTKLANRLKAIALNLGMPVNKFINQSLEVLTEEAEGIIKNQDVKKPHKG